MKKRLIVLAGLAIVLLAIGVVSLFNKATSKASCEAFILNIEKGDAAGTYATFTSHAQSFITADKWKEQVTILKSVYGPTQPKSLGGLQPITDSTSKKATGYRDVYSIKFRGYTYKATCTMTAKEPNKIDSFTSEIDLGL